MKEEEAWLCVSVIWFQYLHPENVRRSSRALLPEKTNKQMHKSISYNWVLFHNLQGQFIYLRPTASLYYMNDFSRWLHIIKVFQWWMRWRGISPAVQQVSEMANTLKPKMDNTQLQCRYTACLSLHPFKSSSICTSSIGPFTHLLILPSLFLSLTLTLSLLVECVGCVSPDSRLRTDSPESISSSLKENQH